MNQRCDSAPTGRDLAAGRTGGRGLTVRRTLYAFGLSSGAPRQRAYRASHYVMASGATRAEAETRAIEHIEVRLATPGYRVRIESSVAVCATTDVLAFDAVLLKVIKA